MEAREETVPETVSSVDLIEAAWAALARRITPVFRLTVSVSHGHLRQARFPLAVGHYSGDTIVSAEASLDAALDGRLRRRLDLDTYPGPMGTVEVVRVPGAHPPGAIVIGLGNVGQLTPQILTSLVAQAAVRHALQVAEAPSGSTWQSAAISSLFIGTDGGGAVGLSDSIRSIVLGVVEANRKLRATDMWNRVRIDRLEFVELFEETAVKAAHVVDSLPRLLERDLTRAEEVFGKPRLEVQQGGEFLRPTEHAYGGGWWRRIQVKANEPATDSPPAGRRALELVYKPLSDQARLQQSTSVQSVDQVARLVGAAMLQPATDLRLSNALFELLVPPALKESFRQQGDLILVLDRHAARYPFELMAYRTNETRPLVTTCGLLRQLEGPDDASGVESNMGRDVLVIGPPVAKGWRALPGASEEAHLVVRLSERYGYRPTALVDANSQDVQKALFASDPRILHIAAHGQYDDDPLQSGVVIGDGEFLTTAHVRAMRTVPELVFLNCCHLGKLGIASRSGTANLPAEGYPALAASLAEGFMTAGARAVVAAGWAIDDTAGQTFARSFYERFLDGEPFGRAVHDARKDTYTNHGGSNTWGAYQCYGSPDFRMRTPAKSVVKRPTRRPVSRSELVAALRSLAGRAGGAQGADLLDIVDEFKERSVQAKEGGWQDGQVLAELAAVAAELGDFHHAIELYRQALNVAKGLAPLSAVEQLANMLGRHAPSLRVAKQSGAAAPALGLFNEALAWLKWLDARLERSPERLALRGSLHKRWALLTSGRQRRQHLRAAADSYEAASKKSTREAYQLLNGLALRYLLDRRRQYAELARLAHAERARCEQALADGAEPTFWDRVAIPDALLHATLFDGQITAPPQVAAITAAYRSIRTTGPSARELASVRDQLEFLAEILSDPDYAKPSAPADCLKPFLDTLR